MAIWHRRPGESHEAYAAFELYRELGTKRNHNAVCAELAKSNTLIERWSRRWHWVSRVQEFDRFFEQKRAEFIHDKRIAALERQAKLGSSMQNLAQTGVDNLLDSGAELSAGEVAKLAEVGQRVERLAMGDSTQNVDERGVQLVFHGTIPPWAPAPESPSEEVDVGAQRSLSVSSMKIIDAAEAEDASTT